ncbi:MAG: hypothetical protein FJ293_09535 [Planctomycetes bacterium]|nr:hypothetical protein [Planctomycetota bacterium]
MRPGKEDLAGTAVRLAGKRMELRAKSIRAAVSLTDGERLLLSRTRPRENAGRLDGWERDLAPSAKLDFALWRHWITPREHASLFVGELWSHAHQLALLGARASRHPVTLICACSDRLRCRCDLVVEMVERLHGARAACAAGR